MSLAVINRYITTQESSRLLLALRPIMSQNIINIKYPQRFEHACFTRDTCQTHFIFSEKSAHFSALMWTHFTVSEMWL